MSSVLEKMKVLAVDDNRTNLHILQVFLKKLGHEVILAEDGQQAVERFIHDEPDLILLDIMMPVMDGFEAARRIKAMDQEKWTPIIFVSALNRDENLVEGLEAGADDYLTKPINFVVLEAKLRSMQRALGLQKTSIEALRHVKAISDNVLDAIITIDHQGIISTVNQSATRIFGWDAAELIGENVKMLMPEPWRSEHDGYLEKHHATGAAAIIGEEREVQAVRKDGTLFPATLGVSKVTLDNRVMFIGVIRDVTVQKQNEAKLRENTQQLQSYFDATHREQQLALQLMQKQLHRNELQDRRLRYKVIATENFSGDIVAAARSPEGRFYAMLADATGHGLTAAISVLPVLALFYRMTRQNRPIREIVSELNQQLKESMPVGRFVGATLVCLDEVTLSGEIWVGGTPDAYLIDRWGRAENRFPSDNLPLGIISSAELNAQPQPFTWQAESQIILYSDGLLEASNRAGEQFGSEGLLGAVSNTSPQNRFQAIETALAAHLGSEAATDDVSLMLIDCP